MKKIHLYLSLPFGILLTLICFSGAMLVFEKEITRLLHPERTRVERVAEAALPLDTLIHRVSATLPDSVSITSVAVYADPQQAWKFNLSKPRKASLMVNPYTAKILPESGRTHFFATMFRLHRWLLGPAKAADGSIGWGKLLVGISTIAFVFVILTGIAVWWPRTRQALRNSLKVPFHRGFRPFARGAHVALGVYTSLFLLVMSLTGLTWSFGWYRDAFYALFGAQTSATQHGSVKKEQQEREKGTKAKEKGTKDKQTSKADKQKHTARTMAWQTALEQMQATCPHYESITLSPGSASVGSGQLGNVRAADKYQIDPHNGTILSVEKASDAPLSQSLRGWIYSVHAGGFGGIVTRILWFVTSLIGATLPLTGYYLWWKRIGRRRHTAKVARPAHKANT